MILLWYNFCFTDTQTCAVVDSRSFNSPIIPDMCGSGQVSLRIKNRRAFDRRFTAFPCVPTGFKKNINCHVHTPYVFRSNTCTAPPVGLLPVSERFALLHNPPPPPISAPCKHSVTPLPASFGAPTTAPLPNLRKKNLAALVHENGYLQFMTVFYGSTGMRIFWEYTTLPEAET